MVAAGVPPADDVRADGRAHRSGPRSPADFLPRPIASAMSPPVNLANTPRIDSLIRAGNLYLSAQDVVALALENNIDIEVQRYGPLLQREVLRRAEAGGLLRNVGLGVAAGPTSVSLTRVTINTNGAPSGAGTGVSAGGGIVTQLGPAIPALDPTITAFANFQHATSPQSNTFLTGTTALIQMVRTYQVQYAQNWVFGLSAQLTYASQHTHVNSDLFSLDPYTSRRLDSRSRRIC